MEIPNINNEKITREAGFQSPTEMEQYMTIHPMLEASGDAVSPCGVFKNSQNHHDAQLIDDRPD